MLSSQSALAMLCVPAMLAWKVAVRCGCLRFSVQRTEKLTGEQRARYQKIRAQLQEEYPPSKTPKLRPAKSGIGFQVRRAREAKGMTWYAVAKAAGIPNQNTVRDIEYGRDVNLSNLEAVAAVLGLRVELVPTLV